MATSLVMPALEMAQESGILVHWLKLDGETVTKGEPVMEVETDKVTVEIEAPASGILGGVLAKEGDVIPVGQTIAWILAPGETVPAVSKQDFAPAIRSTAASVAVIAAIPGPTEAAIVIAPLPTTSIAVVPEVSPVARKMAAEHGIDLALLVKPGSKRIEKADVQAYLDAQQPAPVKSPAPAGPWKLAPASPKARKLAEERGIDLAGITGSGPEGAVLTVDVMSVVENPAPEAGAAQPGITPLVESLGTVWRVMAGRMQESWTTVPHFYLVREVDASQLVEWRSHSAPAVEKRGGIKLTYTDLLVKLLASALRSHPRVNAAWAEDGIRLNPEINVGIATAIEEGLIVPVVRNADTASLTELAQQRSALVQRAHDHKLRPVDITGGTITLTNLGMYNIDAFNAIVNTPQAAILAVGRIADRVVPVDGQPAVRPTMIMTLSCDHRVVDGARAAQFLDDLANLVEDPWRLLI